MSERIFERNWGDPEVLRKRMDGENEARRGASLAEFPDLDAYKEFLMGPPSGERPTLEELRAAAAALGDPREQLRELRRRVPTTGWKSHFVRNK